MLGPDAFSLEHVLGLDKTMNGWLGLALSAGLGILGGVGLLVAVYRPPAPEASDTP